MHREFCALLRSPPTRRCGLKFRLPHRQTPPAHVTSYAEVWIEIADLACALPKEYVTSYAEVWIEIAGSRKMFFPTAGHLLRGGVD